MESFFSLLQKNVLNRQSWDTRDQLRIAIVTWIERTYHRRRRQDRARPPNPHPVRTHHEPDRQSGGLINCHRSMQQTPITSLSVLVAVVIGGVELLGLMSQQLNITGRFWSDMQNADINTLGFIIVGLFIATWVVALAIWRFARIEARWSAGMGASERSGNGLRDIAQTQGQLSVYPDAASRLGCRFSVAAHGSRLARIKRYARCAFCTLSPLCCRLSGAKMPLSGAAGRRMEPDDLAATNCVVMVWVKSEPHKPRHAYERHR